MSSINKISGVSFSTNVFAVDGVSKSSIGSINGISAPSSQTDYVSTGLEFHVNANDSNSWNGTTTWTDLAGTENMTLVNGPTKPSGESYIQFDGNDDRGEVDWATTDYFYGSTSNYTMWNTLSCQAVISFDEDGSTGYVRGDAAFRFGNRYQSTTRGFQVIFDRRGASINIFYGSLMRCKWPNTSEFQYNSSRGYYEPIPGRVYSLAITMDRTKGTNNGGHFNAYLNGSQWTPSGVEGSLTQRDSTSRWDGTYINNSNVRRGRSPWYLCQNQTSSGAFTSSSNEAQVHELIMYTDELTSSEVNQNYTAYTDRYGALN